MEGIGETETLQIWKHGIKNTKKKPKQSKTETLIPEANFSLTLLSLASLTYSQVGLPSIKAQLISCGHN